jgi:hypothetical protein
MKSILINSETQEVKEVTLENVLTDSYNAIGNECGMVQIGDYINDCDTLMVDEEGYFKQGLKGFFYGDNFYYGNAVIWGCDYETGESIDCKCSVEEISGLVRFVDERNAEIIRERILNQPTFMYFG